MGLSGDDLAVECRWLDQGGSDPWVTADLIFELSPRISHPLKPLPGGTPRKLENRCGSRRRETTSTTPPLGVPAKINHSKDMRCDHA